MYPYLKEVNQLNWVLKSCLVASAVKRLQEIFEYNYGEADSVISKANKSLLDNCIKNELANKEELMSAKRNLSAVIPDTDTKGSEYTPSMLTGVATLHAIDSLLFKCDDDVIKSLEFALEAVDSFCEYNGLALQEELAWHKKNIDYLASLDAPLNASKITGVFDKDKPMWLKNWLEE
ncbi:hypothetical protein [Zooshikella harenae]|uniref:DUF892 family protein n=1 Tax=Zooshikella harenae TaxID=2827238 RepID=A0ABS5ZJZ3_9GAMM|nr:hypothetical protein [Zooshikella harenae]MBU2714284.1 hypothetical protein [Zooshikella harenae]